MSQNDDLARFQAEQKAREFDKTKSMLDELRRTRKSRGLGAPLDLPKHLQMPIIITDADMPKKTG